MKKTINFRVDAMLYRQIKFLASCQNKTMTGYLLDLVKKDMQKI